MTHLLMRAANQKPGGLQGGVEKFSGVNGGMNI